jgi:hypothetical protein
MRTFFKGIWHLIRRPRFFLKVWRESYRKLKADPPSPKASAGKGAKRG